MQINYMVHMYAFEYSKLQVLQKATKQKNAQIKHTRPSSTIVHL